MIREIQAENFSKLFNDIALAKNEEDLERISDLAEEMLAVKHLSKKGYKQIDELLDEQLSRLVMKGLI